jgi:hypothetical protein
LPDKITTESRKNRAAAIESYFPQPGNQISPLSCGRGLAGRVKVSSLPSTSRKTDVSILWASVGMPGKEENYSPCIVLVYIVRLYILIFREEKF